MTIAPDLGSIVRCRGREWVVLSTPEPDVVLLRPLAGSDQETCGIYLPLTRFGYDPCVPAIFHFPLLMISGMLSGQTFSMMLLGFFSARELPHSGLLGKYQCGRVRTSSFLS